LVACSQVRVGARCTRLVAAARGGRRRRHQNKRRSDHGSFTVYARDG
jgi:hypothetical protein